VINESEGKFGIVDTSGNLILSPNYMRINQFDYFDSHICDCGLLENIYMVDNGSKKALFSTVKQKFLSDFSFDTINFIDFTNNEFYGTIKKDSKIGVINLATGELIIPTIIDSIVYSNHYTDNWGVMRNYLIKSKLFHVFIDGRSQLYNLTGKLFLKDYNEKEVILVEYGEEIIPVKRTEIIKNENGKGSVKINGAMIYIDQ